MRKILIDTNVIVYGYDRSEPVKQRQAREVIAYLVDRPDTYVSAQIVGETFRALTQRLKAPLSANAAREQVEQIRRIWTVLPVTDAIVVEAMRGVCDYRLSYWDAQVWATAALNQIDAVLTEDLPGAATIGSVLFKNPFDSSFQIQEVH